ncbi:XRE family transcriptional regulator [Pseudovibrio sp. POLY-S9]|uniref:XRE family transcriptional regulator n=1 Tax=Pseudovibrio sp. POLY-S9 TaxID=1576596 RepID=UPI00070A9321|nr:XRE family transcriptional regulator [Pseudovibrio sp. POLY-S9]
MKPSDRLRQARIQAGYSTATDAAKAFGWPRDSYTSNENGNRSITQKKAETYASAFNVSPSWLLFGTEKDQPTQSKHKPQKNQETTFREAPHSQADENIRSNASQPRPISIISGVLPVYGTTSGDTDGFILEQPLDTIPAPSQLMHVPEAYAVYVSGDTMSPRMEEGEAVFVNPRKPAKVGDYVVIQIRDEEAVRCYVKRYEGREAGYRLLAQLNPPEQIKFHESDVVAMHRIVAVSYV